MADQNEPLSLFQYISDAVVDGDLPDGFSLPRLTDKEDEIAWADGAWDGVSIYHMGFDKPSEKSRDLMEKAVQAASDGDFDDADALFIELGRIMSATSGIDAIQNFIIDNSDELNPENVFDYAYHSVVDSTDRECVKYGLSLLELFDTDSSDDLKDVVRTIGLSDEFTIFAIYVMWHWENGNDEVFELAKKVHGWGRIHAVERIEPETDEIRHWMLVDGVHNQVLPAYSALTCWQKSDAAALLHGNLTREEFSGIRDIIGGLLDEGPVPGISEIENGDDHILLFLDKARNLASDIDDYEAIRSIRIHFEDEETSNPEIVTLCNELLSSDKCRDAVMKAVSEGNSVPLAAELGIDYKEDVLNALESSFEDRPYLCKPLMDDTDYRARVLELFQQRLPLDEMKCGPGTTLGLGRKYRKELALEYLMQELRDFPLEGQDFVKTGLQCAPIKTRNGALYVIEEWVSAKKIPLSQLLPEFQELLIKLSGIEPNADVKQRMESLIAGNISFKNNSDDDNDDDDEMV